MEKSAIDGEIGEIVHCWAWNYSNPPAFRISQPSVAGTFSQFLATQSLEVAGIRGKSSDQTDDNFI